MPCYKPKDSVILPGLSPTGKAIVFFRAGLRPLNTFPSGAKLVPIPCGQCIGCRLERSRQWAVRLLKEMKLHDTSSFLTLTYDDKHLPLVGTSIRPTLRPRDMTLFLKNFRFTISPKKIRYFQCGEYGETNGRPHHHMILFGEDFSNDRILTRPSRAGYPQYLSPLLSRLWYHGEAVISEVSFESAAYVARYSLKKHLGPGAKLLYSGKYPEYVTMSRNPGIAADYFAQFQTDVYPHDEVVPGPGRPASLPPKYFDKLLEKVDPVLFEKIKEKRTKDLDFYSDKNSTDSRLETRERVKQALIKNCLKRTI